MGQYWCVVCDGCKKRHSPKRCGVKIGEMASSIKGAAELGQFLIIHSHGGCSVRLVGDFSEDYDAVFKACTEEEFDDEVIRGAWQRHEDEQRPKQNTRDAVIDEARAAMRANTEAAKKASGLIEKLTKEAEA